MKNSYSKPPIVIAPLIDGMYRKNYAMYKIRADAADLRRQMEQIGMDIDHAKIVESIADQKLAALQNEVKALLDEINRFSVPPEDN